MVMESKNLERSIILKVKKFLLAGIVTLSLANADDVLQKSMSIMQKGIDSITFGFMHNEVDNIKEGLELLREGNNMFSNKKLIEQYLPHDKKHMVNVAENQSKRITLDSNVLEINLDQKAYIDAANAYSDIINACSRCHAIVREW